MTCTVCLDLGEQLRRLSLLEVRAQSLSGLMGMAHGLRQTDIFEGLRKLARRFSVL